jgi:phosphatidate cytidylyltransferase
MLKRTIAALILAAIGLPAVFLGGIYFFVLITLILAIASWEFGRLFCASGSNTSIPVLVGGVLLLLLARAFFPNLVALILTALVLLAMTWHLVDYERGSDQAGLHFTVTVAGIIYLGWIGAYFYDLRNLESGVWWFFFVLVSVWLADSFAYFIGVRFGKHRLCPRLSPKKSWEGYLGGIVFGTLGSVGLACLFAALGGPIIPWWKAVIIGAVLSILTTLGDLGESMLKRCAGVKDSGSIMPGHGGLFDRIDSWLWGAVIGYYLITWLFA